MLILLLHKYSLNGVDNQRSWELKPYLLLKKLLALTGDEDIKTYAFALVSSEPPGGISNI